MPASYKNKYVKYGVKNVKTLDFIGFYRFFEVLNLYLIITAHKFVPFFKIKNF